MKGHRGRVALLLLAFALGAMVASCYGSQVKDCKYACGPGGSCPSGMSCRATLCASPGVVCPGFTNVSFDADAGDAGVSDAFDVEPRDALLDERDGVGPQNDSLDTAETSNHGPPVLSSVSAGIFLDLSRLWATPDLTVCWEDPGLDQEKQWVRDAVADSWEATSAITFSGWEACGSAGANLRLRFGSSTTGKPLIGRDADHVQGGVSLRAEAIPGCALSTRQACVAAHAVHRLGHALGFVHLSDDSDDPSACTSGAETPDGAAPARSDPESVMTFCGPLGYPGGALPGARDIRGIVSAYGAGESAIVFRSRDLGNQIVTFDAAGTMTSDKLFVPVESPFNAAPVMAVGRNRSILSHDPDVGRFNVGVVTKEGLVATEEATGVGTWPILTAVQNGYFLGYDAFHDGGTIGVFRVDVRGRFQGRVHAAIHVGGNWSQVLGLPNGEVFFFDRPSHVAKIGRLTSRGKLVIQDPQVAAWGDFDLITSVNLNTIMLFMKAAPGQGVGFAQVTTIDEDGHRGEGQYPAGMPPYLEAIVGARNGVVVLYNEAPGATAYLSGRIARVNEDGVYTHVNTIEGYGHFPFIGAQ